MGIFSAVVGLPLAPVRGVLWIADIVRQQVEEEMYSPTAIRSQLEEIEEKRAAQEISDEEAKNAEAEILDRVTGRGTSAEPPEGSET
ncbi:gas vesicle protein G [Rhodococcus sp. KBS0724]|jgi:hypothetical protein|uniref:gas vesicle protein GvpG n=1 Tax=Rhodococcus sp. KBS0724 TaxID=1179674 RepID=UPI00110E7EA1|nr:gas vesicle protein GvpG [Rhodococcus sp. KBS0724]TSD49020.1 gas vesicle protein G [Rhodococcus sp. KBS0724]